MTQWFHGKTWEEVLQELQKVSNIAIDLMEDGKIEEALTHKNDVLVLHMLKSLNEWASDEMAFFYQHNKEAYNNIDMYRQKANAIAFETEERILEAFKKLER